MKKVDNNIEVAVVSIPVHIIHDPTISASARLLWMLLLTSVCSVFILAAFVYKPRLPNAWSGWLLELPLFRSTGTNLYFSCDEMPPPEATGGYVCIRLLARSELPLSGHWGGCPGCEPPSSGDLRGWSASVGSGRAPARVTGATGLAGVNRKRRGFRAAANARRHAR